MSRGKIAKALGVLALMLLFGSLAINQVKAQGQDTTLIFAESFNQDLNRWGVYSGPNSTVQLQDLVYNSSPSALLINLSDYMAAIIHEIPAVNADYIVTFLFYPENTSFSNYDLYSDFDGLTNRLKLTLQSNFTVQINNIMTDAQIIPEYWNQFRLEIFYNGTTRLFVNNEEIGVFPSNAVDVTGICIGTWPARSESQNYQGCGYFDDLKIFITPIPPVTPIPEPVRVVDIILIASGVGVILVGIIAFLFGRLYFMGRRVEH